MPLAKTAAGFTFFSQRDLHCHYCPENTCMHGCLQRFDDFDGSDGNDEGDGTDANYVINDAQRAGDV